MDLEFKRGSIYTRKSVGEICYPGIGRPKGGNWDTGYVRVENNLIIFMNIGVPGRTGHDFDNEFNEQTNTITWYGKPNSHSKQPIISGLLAGELKSHFFARWNQNDPWTYLGIGNIIDFADDAPTKQGPAIKLRLVCEDAKDIFNHLIPSTNIDSFPTNETSQLTSGFSFEKHLEEYIFRNWATTEFGQDYDIFEGGRQYQTDTGPLDILAISKDKKELLVIELKRGMSSDVAIGQTLRYMGYVKKHLATNSEEVRGCIVGTDADQGLRNALLVNNNIDFYEYKINFEMNKRSFC